METKWKYSVCKIKYVLCYYVSIRVKNIVKDLLLTLTIDDTRKPYFFHIHVHTVISNKPANTENIII